MDLLECRGGLLSTLLWTSDGGVPDYAEQEVQKADCLVFRSGRRQTRCPQMKVAASKVSMVFPGSPRRTNVTKLPK